VAGERPFTHSPAIQRFVFRKNLGFVIAFSKRDIIFGVAFDNPSED
jgi:hypothetical protein